MKNKSFNITNKKSYTLKYRVSYFNGFSTIIKNKNVAIIQSSFLFNYIHSLAIVLFFIFYTPLASFDKKLAKNSIFLQFSPFYSYWLVISILGFIHNLLFVINLCSPTKIAKHRQTFKSRNVRLKLKVIISRCHTLIN